MWFIALILAVPAAAADLSPEGPEKEHKIRGWQAAAPEEPVEPSEEDWVDSTHSYATEQAQALTQWMDEYFGEPNYELEAAESFLRLDFVTDWDQEDGNNNRVRLRGKIQVPRISKRLNIVFSDEGGDELDPGRRSPHGDVRQPEARSCDGPGPHVEEEEHGQEPEPRLAEAAGDVEVGRPVLLGKPTGVEEDDLVERDQRRDRQEPRDHQAPEAAPKERASGPDLQRTGRQVSRDEEDRRHG